MSLIVDKNSTSMKMKIRDVENVFRYRRIPYPKRSVELIALIAISCTFFLFMHTKNLNTRLREMEVKLQPSEFSALGLTGEHHLSGGDSRHGNDINTLHGTYQYLKSTGQIRLLNADTLNNTRKAEVDIMFFNRVPKVGSQSLMLLMKHLAKINGYTSQRDKPKELETIMVSAANEFKIADEIMELTEPAAYSKHTAYINFTHLDFPKPIYINLVRDPIERIVSWFYYIRAPWYMADRKKHFPEITLPTIEWLKKDIASCIRAHDPECIFEQDTTQFLGDHRRQMLFFCGQDKSVCLPFNSYYAMQRAKRTVEKDYAVVGSWEDTNITLAVLEKYIPKFFKNAIEVYHKSQSTMSNVNKNTSRPPVTQDVRNLLSKNLTNEIEFYQFCKQRLYKQYIALSLN